MIFKPPVRAVVNLISPVHFNQMPVRKSEPRNAGAPLGPDAVAAIVDRNVLDGELTMMELPEMDDDVYVVGKRAPDEAATLPMHSVGLWSTNTAARFYTFRTRNHLRREKNSSSGSTRCIAEKPSATPAARLSWSWASCRSHFT